MLPLSISPPSLSLPTLIYNSDTPLTRTITLENSSPDACDVSFAPDPTLSRAVARVDFHIACDGADDPSIFAGIFMDGPSSGLEAGTAPSSPFRVAVPAGGLVDIVATFHPLTDPPEPSPSVTPAVVSASASVSVSASAPASSAPVRSSAVPAAAVAGEDDAMYAVRRFHGALVLSQSCAGCVFDTALGVTGSACRSFVHTDTAELVFDRCALGKRYVKELSVHNRSECETRFSLSLGDARRGQCFEVFDYDTETRIEGDVVALAPLSNYRIMIAFHASEKEESEAAAPPLWLALENMLDARNVIYVKVCTFTTSKMAGAGLDISCGDQLHFGDCYTFEPVWRDIRLRNKLIAPVSITLSSTLQDQVSFEVVAGDDGGGDEGGGGSGVRSGEENNVDIAFQSKETDDSQRGNVAAPLSADVDESEDGQDDNSGDEEGGGGNRAVQRRGKRGRKATKRLFKTERLDFKADETRCIRVWYTPKRSSAAQDGGRLQRRTFQLVFRQSDAETRLIAVEAQACESIVTLGSSDLQLGDCDVLHEYDASVTLYNLSDLPAVVKTQIESKCITPAASTVKIEPRQSFDLQFKFLPTTLNPEYAKEIEFVNCFNRRSGTVAVTVRANNVDQKCISLHAVFYKVLDSSLTNEVNFGRTAANYPALRAFRFQNVSNQILVLGFDETPGVATFVPRWNVKRRPEGMTSRASLGSSLDGGLSRNSSTTSRIDIPGPGPARRSGTGVTWNKMDGQNLRLLASSPAASSPDVSSMSRTLMSLLDSETLVSLHGSEQAPLDAHGTSSADNRPVPRESPKLLSSIESCNLADFVHSIDVVSELPSVGADNLACGMDALLSASEDVRSELMRQWTDVDFVPLTLQANVLSGMEAESDWAEEQLRPGRSLMRNVQQGALVRSNLLSLAPGEESVVCVAITTGEGSVSRRATETSLKVQLVEYDASRLERRAKLYSWRGAMFAETSFEHPPPREVMLYVQVSRSPVMIRPLRILNFGAMTAGSQKPRHFVIDNSDSNACLIFAIQKTRSVASGDVRLGNGYDSGRLGVVRPFSVSTIPFVFRPSLPGKFCEVLKVINVLDSTAKQDITIKATVLKKSNFHVVTQNSTDFGTITYGVESSHVMKLDVHNDTDKLRKFQISVIDRRRSSSSVPQPKVLLFVAPIVDGSGSRKSEEASIAEDEELIAAKKAKLEHYRMKNKAAKAEPLRREIAALEDALRTKLGGASSPSDSFDRAASGDHIAFPDSPVRQDSGGRFGRPRMSENNCHFSVPAVGMSCVEVSLLVGVGGGIPESFSGIDLRPPLQSSHIRTISRGSHSFGGSLVDGFLSGPNAVERHGLASAGNASMTLGIFESKNREICHSVNCSTFVTCLIPRSESTLDTSQLIIPQNEELHSSVPLTSSLRALGTSALPSRLGASTFAKTLNPLNAVSSFFEKALHLSSRSAVVDIAAGAAARLEFGNLQVGVATRRPIQIRNTTRSHALYEFVVQEEAADTPPSRAGLETSLPVKQMCSIDVSGLGSTVAPGELHTFFVSFIALSPGPHSKVLVLKARASSEECEAHQVVLSAFCVRGRVVCLRSTPPHVSSVPVGVNVVNDADLDLGSGIVDPSREYAIVKSIHAVSLVDIDVSLSVRSNLSFQVILFADMELTMPAENVLILARKSTQLWIAVSPRLRKSEIRDGVSKKLMGGLKLETKSTDGSLRLGDATVRFFGEVGSSYFVVKPRFIDLGQSKLGRDGSVTVSGSFGLENMSVGNEAQFSLVTSSPSLRVVSKANGKLKTRELGSSGVAKSGVEASHAHQVLFSLFADREGLINEHFIVQNILAPSLSHRLSVSLFIDSGVFSSSVRSALDEGTVPMQSFCYLSPTPTGSWVISRRSSHILTVSGRHGEVPASITVASNLLVEVHPVGNDRSFRCVEGDGGFGGTEALYRVCSPAVTLSDVQDSDSAVRELELEICPVNPSSLKGGDKAALHDGRAVSVRGGLLILDSRDSHRPMESGLHLSPFSLTYCVSRLRFASELGKAMTDKHRKSADVPDLPAVSTISDIGNFGHCSAWRDELVTVSIVNESDAPAEFGFDALPFGFSLAEVGDIVFSSDTPSDPVDATASLWFNLDAGAVSVVKLRISSRSFLATISSGEANPGRMHRTISIANRMNPLGGLTWNIHGILTSPRLSFEGFGKRPGGRDGRLVLSLPDLMIPGGKTASESFRVKNVSDKKVKLMVEFDKASVGDDSNDSALAAVLKLLEISVSEHVSGVDLSEAKLNPGENLAVRVAATSRGHENESALVASVFGRVDHLERAIGSVRFGCVVGDAVEPSEVIEVRADMKKGEAIVAQPSEIFFSGFIPRDSCGDESMLRSSDNLNIVTVSNHYGQTDVRVFLKFADIPSGTDPVIWPRMAWIEAGSSVDILVGFSKDSSANRSAVYGSGSLLICDITGYADDGESGLQPSAIEPIVTLAVHISPASAEEEEEEEDGLAGGSVSDADSSTLPSSRLIAQSPPLSDRSAAPSPQIPLDSWVGSGRSMSQTELPPSSFVPPGEVSGRPRAHASSSRPPVLARANSGTSGADLFVKGCSQVASDPNRFELVCGQFSVSQDSYIRRITLENQTSAPVEYRCTRIRPRGSLGINPLDDAWLKISRSGGVLAPAGDRGDSQAIVLTMDRRRVDVYSSYLLIESGNGSDVKTVRLAMEVVADGSTPGVADSYFSVICDGRGADRQINYGLVMLDQLYRHRSFVVQNKSGVLLEFMLSSDLPESSRSELTFSLTNAVLRKTSRVIVPPNQHRRVFMLYRPVLEKSDMASDPQAEIDRFCNVRVTCRLMSNYQATIQILSRCRRAILGCDKTDILFDCCDLVGSPKLGISRPEFATLSIRNEMPNLPLVFCVRNQTQYFEVDCPGDVTLPAADGEPVHSIVIRPKLALIRERAQHLLREKYIEEHVSVYNRLFPREFFCIRLRLSIGGAASEFSAMTHKRAFEFTTLEGTISNFLCQFGAFWSQFRRSEYMASLTEASSTSGSEVDDGFAGSASRSAHQDLSAWAKHLGSAPEKAKGYEDCLFEMHYCTDQLVHYCLRNASQAGMQMASMLFNFTFNHDVFATFIRPEGQQLRMPEMMLSWIGQLGHFLSFFPEKRDSFRGLTELEQRFLDRISEQRE